MKSIGTRLFFLFILLFHSVAEAASEPHASLTVSQHSIPTHSATYSLKLSHGESLTLDEVRAVPISQWQAPGKNVPNFGYTHDTVWFRLRLQAPDDQTAGRYYYKVDYPVLDYIAFYIEQDDKITERHVSGDIFPFHQRPFESHAFVLPLDFQPGDVKTLYIELKSEGTLQLPATLYPEAEYHESTMAFYVTQGMYFGVVGIMMFYNLILYFAFRAREFLYYVLYAGMMMLVLSTMHGFNYQYLWPNFPWWNNKAIPFSISMSSLALLLFTYHFLNVRNYSKKLPVINRIFTIVLAVIAAAGFFLPYAVAIKVSALTSITAILLCVFTSYKAWQFKEPAAKQYIFAWFAMLFGAFCFLLAMFGILPSNALTQNTLQIGLGLEIIILSFALAEKIRQVRNRSENERKKRFQMQQVALEKEKELRQEKEKALQVQQSLAVELERQVLERTKELQFALGELSNANIRLQEMCTIDGLTQVHNRRFFDDKLSEEWKRSAREKTPLSVILLDIDHFKSFNDNYGHMVGDECLKFVAKRIESHCRRPADSAARYGGEEFVLILPNTSMEGALKVAEAIRHGVQSDAFKLDKVQVTVTVSVGVATFAETDFGEHQPSDLVHAADKALYRAKEAGRNKVESALNVA
jgi:diguanylate cyclase